MSKIDHSSLCFFSVIDRSRLESDLGTFFFILQHHQSSNFICFYTRDQLEIEVEVRNSNIWYKLFSSSSAFFMCFFCKSWWVLRGRLQRAQATWASFRDSTFIELQKGASPIRFYDATKLEGANGHFVPKIYFIIIFRRADIFLIFSAFECFASIFCICSFAFFCITKRNV